ncbi:hypothetical protein [Synechococcus sp. N26]|uniref:hypothetical protein n=1 Tax=Synechococcus sp. N26 TaxID=2575513 RepID=UPI000E0EFB90|nr:hypothetical protein [Synechococcus sp. N26]
MDADFEQHYQAAERVLQGDVDATIAALAEQGLERCRAEDTASGAGSTPATNGAIPDLLRDPSGTPVPSPEPTVTPEASSNVEVEMANQEPARSEEELPVAIDPTPQEPAAKDLLENSWLRVQLQPDIKNPTDSGEPMGLINRIKGVLVRSAGR